MESKLRRTPGRTYYESSIEDFANQKYPSDIVEFLTESDERSDEYELHLQKNAWINQIKILQNYLKDKKGYIIFEYVLSRVNMRIDVVLLMDDVVYSLEFKNNISTFEADAIDQADGYGYALKNFYEANKDKYVVPILVATKAPDSECSEGADLGIDKLFTLFKANVNKMEQYIDLIRSKYGSEVITSEEEFEKWIKSPFKPNPTIIQSARSIYTNNQVDEFFKFDAGEENLKITENTVEDIVKEAKEHKKKIICFVSGVPGAGKTLVGLDLAGKTRNNMQSGLPETVFFSGNGPLVNVLTEALGRDAFRNNPQKYPSKYRAVQDVKAFIQDLHAFKRDIISNKTKTIDENVFIFDEAQRVWDSEKLGKWFIDKKFKDKSYMGLSEADLLLSLFNEKEWGVIVALVGLGQDIHVGEDGLGVWFESLLKNHPEWDIRLSKEIFTQKADNVDKYKTVILNNPRVKECPGLFLKTSIRTPRAKNLSEFSEALLNNEPEKAKKALNKFDSYPICITRDLRLAESFVSGNSLRKERCGKLCSSNSKILGRLSHSFDNINKFHFADWMLDVTGRDSSNSLIYAASEFDIQGLEIDWSLLGWDMDMYYADGEWHEQKMYSKRFEESSDIQKKHILNAYRVLLTRARKGMVIYIPRANDFPDIYGIAKYYDSTYEYFKSCGIRDIGEVDGKLTKVTDAVRLPF